MLRTEVIGYHDLGHFAWAASRLEELGTSGGIESIVRSRNPIEALSKAFRTLPFPAPPWPGDERLRPITSRSRLESVGRAIGNCMSDPERAGVAASEVVRAVSYYYEWAGEEPGLLRFENAAPLGWVLDEGKGVKNASLSGKTWSEIEVSLRDVPDFAPLYIDSDSDPLSARFFIHQVY